MNNAQRPDPGPTSAPERPVAKADERDAGAATQLRARLAGAFYLLTIVAGGAALVVHGGLGAAAGVTAGASYVAVTVLFYLIFKPVSRGLAALAAGVSLAGCAVGPVSMMLHWHVAAQNISLALFGCYCLLTGYLIMRSTFLPHALGSLMMFASLGWLTFAWPTLAERLYPYNLAPGIVGEGALTLWLLFVGVNARNWLAQAKLRGP